MKTILCTFNLFDLHQHILLADGQDTRVVCVSNLDELGHDIANMCQKYDVDTVHLYGSGTYAEGIVRQIKKAAELRYGEQRIKIEVN